MKFEDVKVGKLANSIMAYVLMKTILSEVELPIIFLINFFKKGRNSAAVKGEITCILILISLR